jgi:hypothetical protein
VPTETIMDITAKKQIFINISFKKKKEQKIKKDKKDAIENKRLSIERSKEYRKQNKEKIAVYRKEYYKKNNK